MIYDTAGGLTAHFALLSRPTGAAVIIEDKAGLKKNSLLGNEVIQFQENIEDFSFKIKTGKNAQVSDDFMIFARCESLILEKGMNDAITRSKAYLNAGADGIMIHSRKKDGKEIMEYCKEYKNFGTGKPLVVVPSSFDEITEKEFEDAGVNIVIYANHMLRAAYPAMLKVAETILKNGRSRETKEFCMSINDILKIIPGTV